MLEKLLRLVATGGIHSHAALARELDTTEALLDSMIQDLVRLGYLRLAEDAACESHCQDCPVHDACGIGGGGRLWTLTDRGMQAARGG